MKRKTGAAKEPTAPKYLGLIWLVCGLFLGAAFLHTWAGPPRLPESSITLEAVIDTLRGSSVSIEVFSSLFGTLAWGVWFWLSASLLLRLLVTGLDSFAKVSVLTAALRTVSDRVTLPIVRRVVDGAVVAIIVAQLTTRVSPSIAAASELPTVRVVRAETSGTASQPGRVEPQPAETPETLEYKVKTGDTLWTIAERFYGSGDEYRRLVSANAGRLMPDGRHFTEAGVIRPDWVLLVPSPSANMQAVAGLNYHVVGSGDTLRGIAARFLGDESRWPTIYDLNRGKARMGDGRVLMDPDLIWPGLRLVLPIAESAPKPDPLPDPYPSIPKVQPAVQTPTPRTAITLGPTPASIPAEASATAIVAADAVPTSAATVMASLEPASQASNGAEVPTLVYGAAGLVAASGAGLALLSRRRARRSLSEPPVPFKRPAAYRDEDDFAEAEFARAFTHRVLGGEADTVDLIAGQALRFIDEQGVDEVSLMTARHGRKATTLTLSTGPRQQTRLLAIANQCGVRLGGTGQASLTPNHDVALKISNPRLAGLGMRGENPYPLDWGLLPLGVLPTRETLYANWRELGNVLIAGLPGSGPEVVLTSLVSALAAHYRPTELRLISIVSDRSLPPQLFQLPHHYRDPVAPDDELAVDQVFKDVRAELVRRLQRAEVGEASEPDEPEILIVVGELADLKDDGTTLEMIGLHGHALGIRLLAATTDPAGLTDDQLVHFASRFVLQTADEDESIRLLGESQATALGSGELLIRLGGRSSLRARGFRVSVERLAELVRLTHEAYGQGAPSGEKTTEISRQAKNGKAAFPTGSPGPSIVPPIPENGVVAVPSGPTVTQVAGSQMLASNASPAGFDEELAPAIDRKQDRKAPFIEAAPAVRPADEYRSNGYSGDGRAQSLVMTSSAAGQVATLGVDDEPRPGQVDQIEISDTDEISNNRPNPNGGTAAGANPLIEVRCFGEFTASSGDREITPSSDEGASFKAWEILAFLSVQPDGAAPKDKLLAAIWPETDEERAANRMRVAMARLRALLARQVPGLNGEVVRCERDGTCRLDTTQITSDVYQFSSLGRAAQKLSPEQAKDVLQQARALYHGDLLTGRGARSYAWLDERDESGLSPRDSYREEYNRITMRLARLHYKEGRPALAVPLYKSLLKAEPTLEDVVRGLYRCYRQLGDLSSLIREDRQLRQALREAYYDPADPEDKPEQYEPEPETIALFKKIRLELEVNAPSQVGAEQPTVRRR